MILEGPLIHHSEVSKQGFCISCTTIWKDPNKVLYQLIYHSKPFGESTPVHSYFNRSKPQQRMVSNGAINLYEKGTKSRRINAEINSKVYIFRLLEGYVTCCTYFVVFVLAYESPPCIHSKPALYVHRVENTEACLSFLDRLGVDLRGVYAEGKDNSLFCFYV